jgi:hypothetical protein
LYILFFIYITPNFTLSLNNPKGVSLPIFTEANVGAARLNLHTAATQGEKKINGLRLLYGGRVVFSQIFKFNIINLNILI